MSVRFSSKKTNCDHLFFLLVFFFHLRKKNFNILPSIFTDKPSPPEGEYFVTRQEAPDKINLRWAPPKDDGGAPITLYHVEMKQLGKEGWSKVATTPDTHYTIQRLQPRVPYIFRVIAENKYGKSEPLDVRDATFGRGKIGE